ncbi:MAG: ankyrin repeat domain-containing protein [Steroidobacteraceae bacterium]
MDEKHQQEDTERSAPSNSKFSDLIDKAKKRNKLLEKLSKEASREAKRKPFKSVLMDSEIVPEFSGSLDEIGASIHRVLGLRLEELPMDEHENGALLIRGAKAADLLVVEFLLARGAEINSKDGRGMTALHHAAAIGARPCIRALMKSPSCDYLARDTQGRYPSDLAIEWAGDYALARLLAWKQLKQAAGEGVPPWILA